MNVRSLRFRLAVWYFCTVTAICALAAAGYWLTVRAALDKALDQGLRYRLIGLREYLEDLDVTEREDIAVALAQISRIGELYQVFDADGTLIAQSDSLTRHDVRQQPPRDLRFEIRYETGGPADFPLRLAWQRVSIGGRPIVLNAADPQRKFGGVLDAFTRVLLLSTPIVLALATLCGVWLGRRALAPVARISEDVRAITDENLSARLTVPDTRDELQHLSETLNAMLERIERSFTRIKQFTADASHELRAPMTLIYAAAQYALRRERSREELEAGMQKILRESERTAALIDDLLLLARGDAGQAPGVLLPTNAEPLLRDLATQAATMALGKGVDLQLRLAAEALPVLAHEPSLRRLLLILIDNAIKFTPAGGIVTICGGQDAAEVTISVADTGTGIGPDDEPHIFERFWRTDKVRAREAGGTGLGLSIAKQIAEQHGARLTVETSVGRGSVFTVRMPRTGTGDDHDE